MSSLKGVVISLDDFEMEPHVEQAFLLADRRAGSQPIDARMALLAAVQVGGEVSSEAFTVLSSLLSIVRI
jgi:hypothetical protein